MSLLTIEKEMGRFGKKLQVKINDNRSTMLSVKWDPDCTRVSMHRMFLTAPRNIMQELACYLKRESKMIGPTVRAFIEDNLQKFNYSHRINPTKLYTQGNLYNLRTVYNELNAEYFNSGLDLSITWFGKHQQRNRSRVTFGLYHENLKLIKIHRLLDVPTVPDYVLRFVVYHEMVHHICRPYEVNGIQKIHTPAFKAEEKKFRHYALAQKWIKDNQSSLFQ